MESANSEWAALRQHLVDLESLRKCGGARIADVVATTKGVAQAEGVQHRVDLYRLADGRSAHVTDLVPAETEGVFSTRPR